MKSRRRPIARPVHAEESRTFIVVKNKNSRIHALLDGIDVTIVKRQVEVES